MYLRTKCISYYNVFCKQFDRNEYFFPLEFSTAGIKIGVRESIQRRPGSANEKFDV